MYRNNCLRDLSMVFRIIFKKTSSLLWLKQTDNASYVWMNMHEGRVQEFSSYCKRRLALPNRQMTRLWHLLVESLKDPISAPFDVVGTWHMKMEYNVISITFLSAATRSFIADVSLLHTYPYNPRPIDSPPLTNVSYPHYYFQFWTWEINNNPFSIYWFSIDFHVAEKHHLSCKICYLCVLFPNSCVLYCFLYLVLEYILGLKYVHQMHFPTWSSSIMSTNYLLKGPSRKL